jgi:hypothetical protein
MAYTYLIIHKPTGLMYYGVRYAKNSTPKDLWETYFTSSKAIKELIEIDGKESFIVEIRKVFATAEDATTWETKVLRRLGVPNNKKFLNRGLNHPLSQEQKEERMLEVYGVKYCMQSQELRQKAVNTWLEKYGVTNPLKSPEVRRKLKKTLMKRYGVEHTWLIPKVGDKSRQTMLLNYGVEWPMQNESILKKSRKTQYEKFGSWKISSDEVVEKRKRSNIDTYGIDNPFKVRGLVAEIMKQKYGVENWSQTKEGKASIKKGWSNRVLLKCPHCEVESKAYSNMKRWHFDNCKNKQ